MSRIAKSVRPAASSFGASVDSPGWRTWQVDPGVVVEALSLRGVDPGVDGVGREIEHEARAVRRARFSAAPAAGGAGEQEDGRQQRDSPSHFAGKPSRSSNPVRLPPAKPTWDQGIEEGTSAGTRTCGISRRVDRHFPCWCSSSPASSCCSCATGSQAQFGSDFAVVGLVHAFLLFGLIVMFGVVSGGHFNPAVTLAAAAIKRITPIDALIYILAQLSGGCRSARS